MSPLASVAKKIACSSWSSQARSNFRTRGAEVFLQCYSIFDYAMGYCDGGSAVDILDAPTPNRLPKPPRGQGRDNVSRWGFALSARPPGPACSCGGAYLGGVDRGNGGCRSAHFSAAFHRPRRHESDLQGGKNPTPCVSRSAAVSGMPAPVPGKERYYVAWSWGFPSANQLYVPAGVRLP